MQIAKSQELDTEVASLTEASPRAITPNQREFALLLSLEKLYVIHKKDSIVLFSYHFHHDGSTIDMDDLYGPAIGMMDGLLGEILSSRGHIKEIMHDDKVLYFAQGAHCIFTAISQAHFSETRTHLDKFARDFEEKFATKLDGQFNFDMDEYKAARSLVWNMVGLLSR
jgi:hypothetical protein